MEFPIHWLVILLIVLVLFGGKKIPEVMRGMGEGIRSFKEGMRGDEPGHGQTTQTPPSTTTPVTTEKK